MDVRRTSGLSGLSGTNGTSGGSGANGTSPRFASELRRAHAAARVAWRRMSVPLCAAIYPPLCALCSAPDVGDGLGCGEHRLPIGLAGRRCARCATEISPALAEGERCAACRRDPPAFARLSALCDYRAAGAREWLLRFKHGGRPDLARTFGELLAARLGPDQARARVFVPIPLHAARRVERGYDQALLLARVLQECRAGRVRRALRRARATTPQGAAGSVSRRANVRDAFAPSRLAWRTRALEECDVWLIDDVATSGATLDEAARVLRKLGAQSVEALVVARASHTGA